MLKSCLGSSGWPGPGLRGQAQGFYVCRSHAVGALPDEAFSAADRAVARSGVSVRTFFDGLVAGILASMLHDSLVRMTMARSLLTIFSALHRFLCIAFPPGSTPES